MHWINWFLINYKVLRSLCGCLWSLYNWSIFLFIYSESFIDLKQFRTLSINIFNAISSILNMKWKLVSTLIIITYRIPTKIHWTHKGNVNRIFPLEMSWKIHGKSTKQSQLKSLLRTLHNKWRTISRTSMCARMHLRTYMYIHTVYACVSRWHQRNIKNVHKFQFLSHCIWSVTWQLTIIPFAGKACTNAHGMRARKCVCGWTRVLGSVSS